MSQVICAVSSRRRERLSNVFNELAQIDRIADYCHVPALDAREVEHLVDELEKVLPA